MQLIDSPLITFHGKGLALICPYTLVFLWNIDHQRLTGTDQVGVSDLRLVDLDSADNFVLLL